MESIKKEYNSKTEWINERGELHRLDGPAIEYNNGSNSWYINGKLHREDGPAIEWDGDRTKLWCLNGIQYPEEQWKVEVLKLKLNRIKDL